MDSRGKVHIFAARNIIHCMDYKNNHIESDDASRAAEPLAAYGVRHCNLPRAAVQPDDASRPDRMSIEVYFDVVWNSYLKKHEALQG